MSDSGEDRDRGDGYKAGASDNGKEDAVMNLPKDPVILLSFVNTKLRDEYHSLEELCEELGVEKDRLVGLLGEIDYEYDKTSNRFV